MRNRPRGERVAAAYARGGAICDDDVATNRAIGEHGLKLIEAIAARKKPGERVNILTHCNAGWLARVDWGTALAPIYMAHDAGIRCMCGSTRRGRAIRALADGLRARRHGVPHTIITDNAGGHLMQHGEVDMCIVGTDRTTANGDVANKIGTYLKALAAHDNDVPFYVALPSSTIDWTIDDGLTKFRSRSARRDEITHVHGPRARRQGRSPSSWRRREARRPIRRST